MGPIKPRLLDVNCGRRWGDKYWGRARALMDGLRNGPYRMCHTASGDVLMCFRGASTVTAGCIKKWGKQESDRQREGDILNPGAPKGKRMMDETEKPGSEQVCESCK